MYSDRRYSLARYSVNRAEKAVELTERFSASLGALAGVAVPVKFRERYGEALQGSIRGTVSLVSTFEGRGGLGAAVRMSADVVTSAALAEALQSAAHARKNTPAALEGLGALAASLWASKDLPTGLKAEGSLLAKTAGAKNVIASLAASEILTSMLEATSQTTERAVFQLSIPPGGELRIDSELFSVLLNGENALHTQSGDWISVSRELLRLNIESASGGSLQGQLIYTERYL